MAGKLFILLAIGLLVATVSSAPSIRFLKDDAPTDQPGSDTEAPVEPTDAPTAAPEQPTEAPAEPDTEAPAEPTDAPTEAPAEPTDAPTEAPAEPDTEAPTEAPAEPTEAPTEAPAEPTEAPTEAPAEPDTEAPTDAPAEPETDAPTDAPTSTETPYSKPTDLPDIVPRSCAERPRKNDWLMIPSPNSCGKFIVCYDHRETEMACPGGLYFNYWQQLCDWPQNVDCHDQ